jgi:hypothetical protein
MIIKDCVLLDISEEDINDISIYTEQDPSIVKLVLRKMLKEYINLIEKEDVIGDSIDFMKDEKTILGLVI